MEEYYLQAVRAFLENYQGDEALSRYRVFVNVYVPKEEDIKAIYDRTYVIKKIEALPSVYGAGQMLELTVGHTVFRIWGEAFNYIEQQAKANQQALA